MSVEHIIKADELVLATQTARKVVTVSTMGPRGPAGVSGVAGEDGPEGPEGPPGAPPNRSELVNIAVTDHTFSIQVNELIVTGSDGTIVAQLQGDVMAYPYPSRTAGGEPLPGRFVKVIKTGTTATGILGRWRQ